MSKRKVTDPVTKFTYDLVRTPIPQTGTGRVPDSQTYFKRNYLDAVKIITPDVYFVDDIALSGTEIPAPAQLINSHIIAADSSAVIFVSGLSDVPYLSSVSSVGGLAKYFVKQNNLTWIASKDFEEDILVKLGRTYSSFSSSSAFLAYLSGTFLPTIVLPQATHGNPVNNLATNTASAFDNTSSGTHKYLIDKLSWLYFLNTSDVAGGNVRPTSYSTSSEVATLIASKLWSGDVIDLEDALKIFEKYLWSNYTSLSSIDDRMVPERYRSSGTGEWVSGTAHRDRLETLVEAVYAGEYFNDSDKKVEEAFNNYISGADLITDTEAAGPFTRLLEAFSFSFADRVGEATEIETLVDIDSCPDDFLPYLADLIGWTLIGSDATRQRNQLRQAVAVYKAKGTKRSIQSMVDTVFGSPSAFNVTSGTLFDLWESYVPNLIFYALATSSTLTKEGMKGFTQAHADNLGLDRYSSTSLNENIKLMVDRIMWELANEYPNNFRFANKLFPRVRFFLEADPDIEYTGPWSRDANGDYYGGAEVTATTPKIIPTQDPNFVFEYRDRTMPIPPWEDIKYYSNCQISLSLLNALNKKLQCFGITQANAKQVCSYIKSNTVDNEDTSFYTNSFLFFTTTEQLPFNYKEIINVKRPKGNELFKYLPYWNSKSSHFKIVLHASSFDFTSRTLDKDSKYALSRVKTLINTVTPAHAIPDIILNVSTVEDTNINLSGLTAETAEMGLSSIAASGASATILTNFAISAVNPRNTNVMPLSLQTVFKRQNANSLSDAIFGSGVSDIYFATAPRNAIRRKNYKYLMEGENIDLRDGKGAAGYQWLYRADQLPSFYPSKASLQTSGIFSLGFIASSLSFSPVTLIRDPNNFGNLIDRINIDPVWHSCQGYNSSDYFYQTAVSSTFPLRGLSGVDSSAASAFFDGRGALSELQYLQFRVTELSFLHEASAMVSGLFDSQGVINTSWPVSSTKIQPTTLSSWYVDESKNVVQSIANQLHENTSAVDNVNYMRDFAFGSTLHRFYRDWLTNYGAREGGQRGPINFNQKWTSADNIISHTYGPYVFNNDFDITASCIDSIPAANQAAFDAKTLVASTVESMIDISWGYGAGVLSNGEDPDLGTPNAWGITNTVASAATSMYVGYPEMRNDKLLSGVEFVDSSTPFTFAAYAANNELPPFVDVPTFALLKLKEIESDVNSQINGPLEWQQRLVLDDNLIVRYGRPDALHLPRLRYKIEPDSLRPDIKNFLAPDSEYQIDIRAAMINTELPYVGGKPLSVWIHTEPIPYTYKLPNGSYRTENSVWSFFDGKWERTKLADINNDTGFGSITGRSLSQMFFAIGILNPDLGILGPGGVAGPAANIGPGGVGGQGPGVPNIDPTTGQLFNPTTGQIIDPLTGQTVATGTQTSIITNEVINPYGDLDPRIGCVGDEDADALLIPTQSDIWGSPLIYDTLTFNFDTNNSNVPEQLIQKVHTKDRKYYIEIFLPEADPKVFILLDTINMHNKTYKQKCRVPTGYGNYFLNKRELKACFDYFTSLATSRLASRNAYNTSDNMGVSGGGRLSYRDNIFGEKYFGLSSYPENFNQVSSLIIKGN